MYLPRAVPLPWASEVNPFDLLEIRFFRKVVGIFFRALRRFYSFFLISFFQVERAIRDRVHFAPAMVSRKSKMGCGLHATPQISKETLLKRLLSREVSARPEGFGCFVPTQPLRTASRFGTASTWQSHLQSLCLGLGC